MAASLAGAIKAHIESQSLGIPVFRDEAPKGQSYPYVTIQEGVAINEELSANAYAGDHAVVETVQVNLWLQRHNQATNAITESYTLPNALARALDGSGLPQAPMKVYGMKVIGVQRLIPMTRPLDQPKGTPIERSGLVHHAITVQVKRNL